jgi:hypothetical protein
MKNPSIKKNLGLKDFDVNALNCYVSRNWATEKWACPVQQLVPRRGGGAAPFGKHQPVWLNSAVILKQSMRARKRVAGLSYRTARLQSLAELFPWNKNSGFVDEFIVRLGGGGGGGDKVNSGI